MKSLFLRYFIPIIGLSVVGINVASADGLPSKSHIQTPLGFYVGVQLGASETHYGLSAFENTNTNNEVLNGTVTSSGFGQRSLVGYRFTKNWAGEVGYGHYSTTTGDALTYSNGTTGVSGNLKEESYDAYVKGILPLADEVDLYAKAGAAYVSAKTKTSAGFSKTRSGVKPAFAGGATYNVDNNFAVDVSYNRIQSSGRIKSADLFTVGFYYYFA